jgi:hypothetical protein
MTKYVKIIWDAAKKWWILPDGSNTKTFNWELFHKFGDHLEFKTVNKPTHEREIAGSTDYYEKYYGRTSRPHNAAKVDRVLDNLVGVETKIKVKTPLTPVKPNRIVIKKSSSII